MVSFDVGNAVERDKSSEGDREVVSEAQQFSTWKRATQHYMRSAAVVTSANLYLGSLQLSLVNVNIYKTP